MRNWRVKMKKIESVSARQVAISKRKKGLFKKAKELSVLCDVMVAAIVFSHSGKLHHYSSTSTDEILSRYRLHRDHNVHQALQVGNEVELSSKLTWITHLLRGVVQDGILDMGLYERQETVLGNGLRRVASLIKEAKLREGNRQLHQTEPAKQMLRLFGKSNSNVEAAAAATDAVPRGEEDSPIDTTLRLG